MTQSGCNFTPYSTNVSSTSFSAYQKKRKSLLSLSVTVTCRNISLPADTVTLTIRKQNGTSIIGLAQSGPIVERGSFEPCCAMEHYAKIFCFLEVQHRVVRKVAHFFPRCIAILSTASRVPWSTTSSEYLSDNHLSRREISPKCTHLWSTYGLLYTNGSAS